MEKEDLRIVKTKKVLYESLMTLLKKQTFEDIKVSDICNNALVNRSTFYAHFNDKYDLLSNFIDDLRITLSNELNENTDTSTPKQYYIKMIDLLLHHIDERKDIYKAILINNRNSILVDMFYDTVNKDILKHLETASFPNKNSIPDEVISKFYSSAVSNICIEWLKSEKKYSKSDIIKYLNKLIPDNPYV